MSKDKNNTYRSKNIKKSTKAKKNSKRRKKKKDNKKSLIIMAISIVSILALVLCFFLYLSHRDYNKRLELLNQSDTDINVALTCNDSSIWDSITLSNDSGMRWLDNGSIHTSERDEDITFSDTREIGTVIEISPIETNGRFSIKNNNKKGYPGVIRLYYTDNGLKVTNYVTLEEYLLGVINSEMPESYGLEALKAQAVCARSYVLRRDNYADEEIQAQVNDTVSYQVYGNTWAGSTSLRAVHDTVGEVILTPNRDIANAMFYSTSCGYSQTQYAKDYPYLGRRYISLSNNDPLVNLGFINADEVIDTTDAYEKAFALYIMNDDYDALEKNEAYFRWEAVIDKDNTQLDSDLYGRLRGFEVLKRSGGGVITRLRINYERGYDILDGELEIRKKLGKSVSFLKLNDNSTRDVKTLPSSTFTIVNDDSAYHLYGGGFGHGCGLSQNAAKSLSDKNKSYKEIIEFFYKGCTIEKLL